MVRSVAPSQQRSPYHLIRCSLLRVLLCSITIAVAKVNPADVAQAKESAGQHFHHHGGVKTPNKAFVEAVNLASYEPFSDTNCDGKQIDGYPGQRRVVLMAMANDLALNWTVPTFFASLANISVSTQTSRLQQKQQRVDGLSAVLKNTLAQHLVLVCSSESAVASCRSLGLGERCVHDADAPLGKGSLPFHTIGFNMIGFGKIKYILNALSLNHDVIFLDTDMVVFKDFIPHVLSMGADIASTIEKCHAFDHKMNFNTMTIRSASSVQHDVKSVVMPMFNIGVTYFRATPAVLRCTYAWLYDMWREVEFRPNLWDQDLFMKVVTRCTRHNNVSLHALSPRYFNSACFKPCGCNYSDETMKEKPGSSVFTVKMPPGGDVCPVDVMSKWAVMHFPCSGQTMNKVVSMQKYADMYHSHVDKDTVMALDRHSSS